LLVLFVLLAWTAPARAQAPADTIPGERHRPWHETPTWIMARSAVVPGWGQFKNGRPLKAGLAIGAEGFCGYKVVQAWQDVNAASAREDAALGAGDQAGADAARADYEEAYNRRATAGWILAGTIVLSMLDAYVDAHLLQFDADFGPDPALPDDATGFRAGSYETRASLRWSFTGP
jgi:hypothetical protein